MTFNFITGVLFFTVKSSLNILSGFHLLVDCILETLAHSLKGNPLHDRIKKTFDDQSLGFRRGNAAAVEVEDLFRVDLAYRGSVRAADVVRQDFQAGDRVSPGFAAEHQVSVRLIAIRL